MEDQKYQLKSLTLTNGETLTYREAGNSSTVLLLLHGALVSSLPWTQFMPQFSEDFHVFAPDFRGHGSSSFNNPAQSHDEYAEDIKLFADALGLKKFFVLGWSMGGGIAMKFAANYPEYVQGLILHNSMGLTGVAYFKMGPDGKPTEERVITQEDCFNHPRPIYLATVINEKDNEKIKFLNEYSIYNGRNKPEPERLQKYMEDWYGCRAARYLAHLANTYNITSEDNPAAKGSNQISKIKCPVLILHGEKDIIVPKAEAEKIKAALGDLAELKIYPEAGHTVMEDYPEEFVSTVKEFCLKAR